MDIINAYNSCAAQYDTNDNKTSDLEALTLKKFYQERPTNIV